MVVKVFIILIGILIFGECFVLGKFICFVVLDVLFYMCVWVVGDVIFFVE